MSDATRQEAESWLQRAHDDLGAARKLLSGNDPFPATAAYHCQQAAEKALNAVIVGAADAPPKTHDLRVLIARCIRIDPALAGLQDACDELTPYATEFRYPTETQDPDPCEVQYAIDLAQRIVNAGALSLQGQFPT